MAPGGIPIAVVTLGVGTEPEAEGVTEMGAGTFEEDALPLTATGLGGVNPEVEAVGGAEERLGLIGYLPG